MPASSWPKRWSGSPPSAHSFGLGIAHQGQSRARHFMVRLKSNSGGEISFGADEVSALVAQVTPVAENPEPIEAKFQGPVVMSERRVALRIVEGQSRQIVPLPIIRFVAKLPLRSPGDGSVLAGEEQTPSLRLELIGGALKGARCVFWEVGIPPLQHAASPPIHHGGNPTAKLVQNRRTVKAHPELVEARRQGPVKVGQRLLRTASFALQAEPRKVVGFSILRTCLQHRLYQRQRLIVQRLIEELPGDLHSTRPARQIPKLPRVQADGPPVFRLGLGSTIELTQQPTSVEPD